VEQLWNDTDGKKIEVTGKIQSNATLNMKSLKQTGLGLSLSHPQLIVHIFQVNNLRVSVTTGEMASLKLRLK
jgi:hypothetical protein